MARTRVTVVTCDSCGLEADVSTYRIGEGSGYGRPVELCVKCAKPLVALLDSTALAARRRTPVSDIPALDVDTAALLDTAQPVRRRKR